MNVFLFIFLLVVTILFYMLEISFASFSRIALAGLLDGGASDRVTEIDLVANYEKILHTLRSVAFLLQLGLFIFSFLLLEQALPNPFHRIILLLLGFLMLFNFFLYVFSFSFKDSVLRNLLFLIPVAWFLFFPFHLISFSLVNEKPIDKEAEDEDLSDKELEVFFEEGAKEGVLETEDKEMIESVIEFGDTRVKEIITPRVDMIYVEVSSSLDQLVETINRTKRSRYPVIVDRIDNIEGVILAKDVFNYWHKDGHRDFNIRKIMRKAFFVPDTMRIIDLLKELQKSMQKFAIVVDEFGGISGLVTMEDIIEELVGDIHDEYDTDPKQIVEEMDYFIVKGDTDIFELGERLGVDLEGDEDYQTVAGLVSFKLGKIPDESDSVVIENYSFQVLEVEKNRVIKVKISKKNDSPELE